MAVASRPDRATPHVAYRIATSVGLSTFCAGLLLAILYAVLFMARAPHLGLYDDDWNHMSAAVSLSPAVLRTWPFDYRPFEMIPWFGTYALFGPHLVYYYALDFVLQFCAALALYLVARRVTGHFGLALFAALLFACYPADPSVFWLATIAYRIGVLCCLLAFYLLLPATAVTMSSWRYWAALLMTALCLLSNEAFLALLVFLLAVAGVYQRRKRERGVATRAAPFVLTIIAYLGYRFWLGPHILHFRDGKAGQYAITLANIVHMSVSGIATVLPIAWHDALRSAVPGFFQDTGAIALGPAVLLALLACGFSFGTASALWVTTRHRREGHAAQRYARLQPGVRAVLLGAAAIIVGYLPLALSNNPPSTNGNLSRVNAAAEPGAVLFLLGTLWLVTHWHPERASVRKGLFAVGAVLLFLCAMVHENIVATRYTAAWAAESRMWRNVLMQAPAIRAGTFVLIATPDLPSDTTIVPVTFSSIQNALRVLYPYTVLRGDVLPPWQVPLACTHAALPDADLLPHFESSALKERLTGTLIPYSHVLVFRYDQPGHPGIVHGSTQLSAATCRVESFPDRIIPSAPHDRTSNVLVADSQHI